MRILFLIDAFYEELAELDNDNIIRGNELGGYIQFSVFLNH